MKINMVTKMTERARSRLQGLFQLQQNQEAYGELLLQGRKTVLSLSSQSQGVPLEMAPHLYGTTLDRQKVTCIDCVITSQISTQKQKEVPHQSITVFPHFVTVGDEHVDPELPIVTSIHFAIDDLSLLFNDFDAFGLVVNAKPLIDSVLAKRRLLRPVVTGEFPLIAYFSGRLSIIEVETDIGKLSVNHQPSHNMGGANGIFIKNRMRVNLEPDSPVSFGEAVDRMMIVTRFLSLIAGCRQGLHDIQLRTSSSEDQFLHSISVYWSYAPKGQRAKVNDLKPCPTDVPLNPIHRQEEFAYVLKNWIGRETNWRLSRVRYVNCLSKGNSYNTDRLIAAANMFDLLPRDAVPLPTVLPEALAEAQEECLKILMQCPKCLDRDSAISALKRMGKPSLPKKILFRTAIVEKHFGNTYNQLSYVVKIAVRCRNYFVHGPSDDFNFRVVEPLMSFLTDSLEFVFAASDLIESGWDAAQWNRELHGTGHTFARFRFIYDIELEKLKLAMETTI